MIDPRLIQLLNIQAPKHMFVLNTVKHKTRQAIADVATMERRAWRGNERVVEVEKTAADLLRKYFPWGGHLLEVESDVKNQMKVY